MKKILSDTIIYGTGAILPRIILFILNPLYINELETTDFAKFANLYAIISFINIVLSFGFETAYFRFSAEKDNEKKTFNTSFWFLTGLSGLFLILVLLFNQPIANSLGYQENPEFIRWFAWIAFLDNLVVIPFAWLRFKGLPIKYSAVRVMQSLFQTVVVVALFLWIPMEFSQKLGMREKVAFPFFSNLMGSLLGVILLFPVILKVRFEFVKDLFLRMLKYAFPVMIAGLAFMVNENYALAIQMHHIPKGDAGAYGGTYKLAVLMTLFVTAYRLGIEPFFFKQMNSENSKNTYAKVAEYFAIFSSVVALGIITNISWLKLLFIPDKSYWIALDIIPIIVIANLFFGVYYNFSTWYKVTDRTHFGTIISWVGAAITIVLNLLLLSKYGFMVSAWVKFLSYFMMMVLSYWLGQKYYPIDYSVKKMAFFMILLMVFSLITVQFFKYDFWMSNVLFIIYLGLVLYSEKSFILSKIKK